MSMNIPHDRFEAIGRDITSDDSPVGIDARKTHIIIIHFLESIQGRLERIEQRLDQLERRA